LPVLFAIRGQQAIGKPYENPHAAAPLSGNQMQAHPETTTFLALIQFRQLTLRPAHHEQARAGDELAYSHGDTKGTGIAPLNSHQRKAESPASE
jgi:hypothetical protein